MADGNATKNNAFMAAVVGAAAGAAAVLLSDPKNRKVIRDKIDRVRQDVEGTVEKTKKTSKAKIVSELDKAKKQLASKLDVD